MIREARAVVLLLLGNAMLRLALGGGYVDYVKPAMRIPLIVAGAALALLGAGRLLELVLGHAHGHGHDHGPRVAWLLVLPVFAILLIAPPPLGAYAAGRESGAVARPASTEYAPLPAGETTRLRLSDYAVRAVWDSGRTLADRTVALTGFVTPRQEGGWYLTRMTLVCCAADARATKIVVRGVAAPPADAWVSVTGRHAPSADADPEKALAVLTADSVTPVPAPAETYE